MLPQRCASGSRALLGKLSGDRGSEGEQEHSSNSGTSSCVEGPAEVSSKSRQVDGGKGVGEGPVKVPVVMILKLSAALHGRNATVFGCVCLRY